MELQDQDDRSKQVYFKHASTFSYILTRQYTQLVH